NYSPMWEPFRQQLSALGYIEGRNISIESRSPEGTLDSFAEAATELVQLPTDVLAVYGTSATQAAQRATTRIPIVMMGIGDPVGARLVATLARPGGHITGNTVARANDVYVDGGLLRTNRPCPGQSRER